MAVPKKKTSKSKTRMRRASNWTLEVAPRSLCPNCRAAKLPHVVCHDCGHYNGQQVISVNQ